MKWILSLLVIIALVLAGKSLQEMRAAKAQLARLATQVSKLENRARGLDRCAGVAKFRACFMTFSALAAYPREFTPRKIAIVGFVSSSDGEANLYPDEFSASRKLDESAIRLQGEPAAKKRLVIDADRRFVRIFGTVRLGPDEASNDVALGRLEFDSYYVVEESQEAPEISAAKH